MMNVEQLIKALEKMPKDAEVRIEVESALFSYYITDVEQWTDRESIRPVAMILTEHP